MSVYSIFMPFGHLMLLRLTHVFICVWRRASRLVVQTSSFQARPSSVVHCKVPKLPFNLAHNVLIKSGQKQQHRLLKRYSRPLDLIMASQRLNIVETDEAGKRLAMYVVSKNAGDKEERIDVVHPDTAQETTGQTLLDIFLPAGFPHSVTSDYVE